MYILLMALTIFPVQAQAWSIFEPKSYHDCILENMKGVTSDKAAIFIRSSCREKFPQTEAEKMQERCDRVNSVSGLSLEEFKQLDGYKGHSSEEILTHLEKIGVYSEKARLEVMCEKYFQHTR
ncbi:hypothetical protein [Methylomonas sp. UP202]|uniref:hypothetical protein n=1 Tax=Methylomonas sp. UP202 TaxID=3040943 RepID=UPI0024790E98|nr:hypothetical protein [Methylomonas sp. UP202]WGS85828.1 hypothetical protein QC632_22780 [Methylomonas sp. UP202]